MRGILRWRLLALPLAAVLLPGCCEWCRQSCYVASPSRTAFRSPGILPPHPLAPRQVCPVAPPVCPPAPTPLPPASPPQAANPLPPGPVHQVWGPPAPGVRLEAPQPGGDRLRDSARLFPPESAEPPKVTTPDSGKDPTPPLPVGIADFAEVRPGVSTGRRPLIDGLDWLRAKGYRTALNVRRPGDDDTTDRRELESRRGLKYLALDLSPHTLTAEVVERFNKIVADADNRPLFVYGSDPMLVGGLWYLYFRTAEKLGDAEARAKAARLGLKEDENGPHREMWLAIQRYLSEHPQ